jgi:hypothetical protein
MEWVENSKRKKTELKKENHRREEKTKRKRVIEKKAR